MEIGYRLERLEEEMRRRCLRGHIYVTPDGPAVWTTTTTRSNPRTGQQEMVGPRPITDAAGGGLPELAAAIAAAAKRPDRQPGTATPAPVTWNTNALVVTGTTAAYALITALHHPAEYDDEDLDELAARTPWRTEADTRNAFEALTGAPPGGPPPAPTSPGRRSEARDRRIDGNRKVELETPRAQTPFTRCAAELSDRGETPELGILIIRGIPRTLRHRTRAEQAEMLRSAPVLTGTKWDGMLAAVAEHLSWLHGHPAPQWVDEQSRFNDPPTPYGPMLRQSALATAPGAFIRHATPIAGHELDARGGERVNWTESRA